MLDKSYHSHHQKSVTAGEPLETAILVSPFLSACLLPQMDERTAQSLQCWCKNCCSHCLHSHPHWFASQIVCMWPAATVSVLISSAVHAVLPLHSTTNELGSDDSTNCGARDCAIWVRGWLVVCVCAYVCACVKWVTSGGYDWPRHPAATQPSDVQ